MKRRFSILFFVFLLGNGYSQNFMINGDFENWTDYTPFPNVYDIDISYIAGWQSIKGTCDVVHPANQGSITGTPHTGVGCGRFFAAAQFTNEFCTGTTNPLSSGTTYMISFWVKAMQYSGAPQKSMAVAVSNFIPTINPNFSANVTPIIELVPTTTYQQIKFCYTPEANGTHYLTFGPWFGYANSDENKVIEYNIDDVEVSILDPNTPPSVSEIILPQPTYCVGDEIIVDGSNSQNEENYSWEVYKLFNGQQLEYSTGQITGQASTFDVSSVITLPEKGACYRVYLTTTNACNDETYVQFCYEDPDFSFIDNNDPVCINQPVDVEVSGDANWTYEWKQGNTILASGVGLQTIAITPTTLGNVYYTVNITTELGCTASEIFSLNVQNTNNNAPLMNGINGTNEYTAYVSAGDILSFSSEIFNDNFNDGVENSHQSNLFGSSYSFTYPPNSIGILNFNWNTNGVTPGIYYFTIISQDLNQCNPQGAEFKFTIIVNCDHCPTCVSFEDRSSTTTPLPPETKVGKCIEAGLSQDVIVENPVLFQAGQYILLGEHFDSGTNGNFEAIIDPATCITDCENCCDDWTGFTYDFIEMVIDVTDNDPTNDIWQVTDFNHPYCAYNAMGYKLKIWRDELEGYTPIYEVSSLATSCCEYESPSPDNPISHASIWWDGYYNGGLPVGAHELVLILIDCEGTEHRIETWSPYLYIAASGGLKSSDSPDEDSIHNQVPYQLAEILEERKKLEEKIDIFPNPADEIINITGIDLKKTTHIQFFDAFGRVISNREPLLGNTFNISNFATGTYYIRIYTSNNYALKKFIKL